MIKKKDAYLVGPFIGELHWECYRFAPYAIHLKKNSPKTKLVVFTRPSRFDLYGKYADIFVPLVLKREQLYEQRFFNLIDFDSRYYGSLIRFFRKKYRHRFEVKGHFFPDIDVWRHKVKWQFPRDLMDYDFKPRSENEKILSEYMLDSSNCNYVVSEFSDDVSRYNTVFVPDFKDFCTNNITNKSSLVGCLINLLRGADFLVGNLQSFTSKLALLLGTPVISVNESMTLDSIKLINPFNTTLINCKYIEEGVNIHEEYYKTDSGL